MARRAHTVNRTIIMWISLASSLIVLGWVWIWLSFSIPGFGFSVETENGEFFANISFLIGYIGIFIGLALFSKLEDLKSPERQIQVDSRFKSRDNNPIEFGFKSFARSRLIVGLLFLCYGLVTFFQFGYDFGRVAYKGEWFALSGPSVFYAMGAIPTLFGIGLILYSIVSRLYLEITKNDQQVEILEKRALRTIKTTISLDRILKINIDNTKLGPKLFWVVPLTFYAVYTSTAGLSLLTNPETFGYGWEVGIMYFISGVVGILGLFLISAYKHDRMVIHTIENIYEIQFYFPKNEQIKLQDLARFITSETNTKDDKEIRIEDLGHVSGENSIFLRFLLLRRFYMGLVFVIIGCTSKILMGGAGNYVRWILFMFGITLIIEGIMRDRSNIICQFIAADSRGSSNNIHLNLKRNSSLYNHSLNIKKPSPTIVETFTKLNFFDTCYLFVLFFFCGSQLTTVIGLLGVESDHITMLIATFLTIINIIMITYSFLLSKETTVVSEFEDKMVLKKNLFGIPFNVLKNSNDWIEKSFITDQLEKTSKQKHQRSKWMRITLPAICFTIGILSGLV